MMMDSPKSNTGGEPIEQSDIDKVFTDKYERRFLASYPDPVGTDTLTLVDELGNGGFHSKLYSAPIESYHIYSGPTLPVSLFRNR